MFVDLKKGSEFRDEYFQGLKCRLAFASLEMEGEQGDLAEISQANKIFNQLEAINYIFSARNDEEKIGYYEFFQLLTEVVSRVSGGEVTEFRTTDAIVNGSNVERSNPAMIRNDLMYLLQDYNYLLSQAKNSEEILEAEAFFHIRLLHIHPFEDYNGRTARVLLTYNLCNNNIAPCIITPTSKKEYCDLIEAGDVKGLAQLFKKLADMEFDNMAGLYEKLVSQGKIPLDQQEQSTFSRTRKNDDV